MRGQEQQQPQLFLLNLFLLLEQPVLLSHYNKVTRVTKMTHNEHITKTNEMPLFFCICYFMHMDTSICVRCLSYN